MKTKWELSFLLATAAFSLPSRSIYPGGDGPYQATLQAQGLLEESFLKWELPPNPNSTHHLIFNGVSGFLQRWPNTRWRNGHSIVPATIPTGTLLYHGRTDNRIPDTPEWFAFDFEHSYLFCVSHGFMISLQAKRDLRLLYFDGAGAAKMDDGPMESQDIVAWGKPRPDKRHAEWERINALCEWGKPYGVDGFIRMEFDFEVMMCDISDSLEVVTHLELLPKNATEWNMHPPPPPGWHGSLPPDLGFFEAHVAGGWHNLAPGETRAQLDYTGLITFYDPALSSLVDARQGTDRMHYRIERISEADASRVLAELRSVLTRKQGSGSSVDWASIARVVVERYGDRLEYLRFLLSSNATATFTDVAEQAFVVRARLLVMLGPYITTVDVPHHHQQQVSASAANISWLAPVVHRCATTLTSSIPLGMLTPQEVRIHAGVENTLREICRRLALLWTDFFDIEGADEAKAAEAIEVGHRHIDELMNWLGWSVWVRCEPACALGENCYLPTWPFYKEDDPYNMTPRCISRKEGVVPILPPTFKLL